MSFGQGLAYFRYQFCRTLIHEAESLRLHHPRSAHHLKFYKCRLTAAEFSWAYVAAKDMEDLVAESDVDPTTKWEVLLHYAWFVGFTTMRWEREAEYLKKSLDALRAIGQEESAAGCIVLKEVARAYEEDPPRKEELLKRALEVSKGIGDPSSAYGAYVELGHLYLDQGEHTKAEEAWQAAVELAQRYHDDWRIADALNRLSHALTAMGRLSEAEAVLNSAMAAAKRLPDTFGAGRDKEEYIKRHFGILYQMWGKYDKAIQYYSESVQMYRQRRSIGGRLRTLVLLAGCLYEAGRPHEIEKLEPEIEDLAPKLGVHEVVASWLTLRGHMLLDEAIRQSDSPLDGVIAMYGEALTMALESHIIVLDEMVTRVLWKLGFLAAAGKEREVAVILNGLVQFWKNGNVGDQPLTALEYEKRRRFAGVAKRIEPESQTVARLESALAHGLPPCKPSPWLAY
jgi:tetratricopeptide (TPR) repeat protein